MAEVTASDSRTRNKRSGRTLVKRSTRVDLTPMVDLGFLLVTFFVFTTSMSEPKIMNLMESNNESFKPVKESATLTFILGDQGSIFYYYGKFKEQGGATLHETSFAAVRNLILEMKRKTDPDYLMFQIKSTDQSTIGNHIALLDEFTICDIPAGHFAEVDLTKEELKWMMVK